MRLWKVVAGGGVQKERAMEAAEKLTCGYTGLGIRREGKLSGARWPVVQ